MHNAQVKRRTSGLLVIPPVRCYADGKVNGDAAYVDLLQ